MADDLIGCRLVVDAGTAQQVVAAIVEVEAYLGLSDPASHAFRGPTQRAQIMFGAPGHLYVYLSRGIHHCANLVTETTGTAGAVLLRAAVVESGLATAQARRPGVTDAASLLRGPGNLCRGLGLTLLDNGIDVGRRGTRLHVLGRPERPPIAVGRRVGISAAADRPLRFAWAGHPAVSHPTPVVDGA